MNYLTKLIALFITLAVSSLPVQIFAGTIIQSVNDDGTKSEVWIEGSKARMNFEPQGSYMLLDLATGKTYMVDRQEGIIVDLDSEKPKPSEHTEIVKKTNQLPQIKMTKIGAGPVIAGYPTTAYRITIGKQHCFDEYLSEKLGSHPDIQRFISALAEKSDATESVAIGMAMGTHNACDAADDMADDYYTELGVPLRTVDINGTITHNITSINLNASFPKGTFDFPEAYPILTRKQMLQRAMKEMPSTHHDSMTDMSPKEMEKMQQIMRQMQQQPVQ